MYPGGGVSVTGGNPLKSRLDGKVVLSGIEFPRSSREGNSSTWPFAWPLEVIELLPAVVLFPPANGVAFGEPDTIVRFIPVDDDG